MTAEGLLEQIEQLLQEKAVFAAYRMPGESIVHLVRKQEDEDFLHYKDIQSLNTQKGFVIAPFHVTEECPIILIPGEEEKWRIEESDDRDYSDSKPGRTSEISADYASAFHVFMEKLSLAEIEKLVLSRQYVLPREEKFSVSHAFMYACKRYIRSYVYLFYTPQTGIWMGSTPEILLSGEGDQWHTVALAGTQQMSNSSMPEVWDEKNRREQQLVSDYIRNQLTSLGIAPEVSESYTVRAGDLVHLKSDFHFRLSSNAQLGDLLQSLHPTPAVSGLPKADAYKFILEEEQHKRLYYSGFIGMLQPEGRSDLYVNLRCMHIKPESLVLYAGGGLLPSSELEEEWEETEAKLGTMKAAIYYS